MYENGTKREGVEFSNGRKQMALNDTSNKCNKYEHLLTQ